MDIGLGGYEALAQPIEKSEATRHDEVAKDNEEAKWVRQRDPKKSYLILLIGEHNMSIED